MPTDKPRVTFAISEEKLVDYADDLAASGKYIKSDPNKPGKAKDAKNSTRPSGTGKENLP